jgi:hypothetical protein
MICIGRSASEALRFPPYIEPFLVKSSSRARPTAPSFHHQPHCQRSARSLPLRSDAPDLQFVWRILRARRGIVTALATRRDDTIVPSIRTHRSSRAQRGSTAVNPRGVDEPAGTDPIGPERAGRAGRSGSGERPGLPGRITPRIPVIIHGSDREERRPSFSRGRDLRDLVESPCRGLLYGIPVSIRLVAPRLEGRIGVRPLCPHHCSQAQADASSRLGGRLCSCPCPCLDRQLDLDRPTGD